jgi:hypothetical protein
MTMTTPPSELEEAIRRRPGVAPDLLIEDLAEELGILGEVKPPVDLRLLASLQSIVSVEETPSRHSGCLINHGGRLRIEVCATDSPRRQNFTIGHEICHTLLPGFTLTKNFRCNPGGRERRQGSGLDVEWLADVGASELLLPRRFVRQHFDASPFGWDSIDAIANAYQASREATARRYVRLASAPAVFVNLTFATSRNDPSPKLRVKSASWSPKTSAFIPPNKSIPPNHPLVRATEGEFIDEVVDLSPLRAPGKFRVSARPSPYTDQEGNAVMRVLVLGIQEPRRRGGQ